MASPYQSPSRKPFTASSSTKKSPNSTTSQTAGQTSPAAPDVLDTVLDTLKFLDLGTPPIIYFPDDERDLHEKRVPTLLLDWARTVMLQDWKGTAVVSNDGPFGGALATMAAICELSTGYLDLS